MTKNGEITEALSEGVCGHSQLVDNPIEDLRDLDVGQAELPDMIQVVVVPFRDQKMGKLPKYSLKGCVCIPDSLITMLRTLEI